MNTNDAPVVLELEPVDNDGLPQGMPTNLPALPENSPASMMLSAMRQGASLDRIEKMLDLQERWERREAEKAFNDAFAAFRGEELTVLKDKQRTNGPLQGQKYATLHAFVQATKEALSKHGLSVSWKVTRDEPSWIEVTCVLKHKLGHSETVSMGGTPDNGPARNALQARHSTVSYLERYTLKAICGLAEQDDDDDGAGGAPASGQSTGQSDPVLQTGREKAMAGTEALSAWWGDIGKKERQRLQRELPGLRCAAEEADRASR